MHVLVHHQHRLAGGKPLDLRGQRRQCFLLALLRCQVERRIALASGDREQVGEQRRNRTNIVGRLCQQGLELIEPLFSGVVAVEGSGAFEVGDNRVEGAVLMMRRAEEAQPVCGSPASRSTMV